MANITLPSLENLKYPDTEILVFAKAPIPGQVKTRLIPAIGAEAAAKLYQQMLQQTLKTVVESALCKVRLLCTPDTSHPFLQSLSSHYSVPLDLQEGNNLGERMFNAAFRGLNEFENVILIGSDCPEMSASHLEDVMDILTQSDSDVVIIPAHDGGYVLLGLHRIDPVLFEGVSWGTEVVMSQTRGALEQLQWHWKEMEPLKDLDTFEDIKDFVANEHQYQLDTDVRQQLEKLLEITQE